MKRLNILQSLLVLFVFSFIIRGLVPSAAEGAVPQLINFQGVLKDGSGNPVADGNYSVTFTVYDAAAGGNAFWAETTSVTTTNGLFTVLLGSTNPVPDSVFHDTTRFLGVKVGADPEMTPRQQFSSVGYGYVSSQWNQASFNRLYRLGGFVGIGTDNPVQTLHVSLNGTNTAILVEDPTARARFGLLSPWNNEFGFKSAAALQIGTISDNSFSDFSEKMRITPSGNVGIGTASPTAKLHIGGTAGVDGIKFPDGTLQTTAASGGGGWTDDGAVVRLTTTGDNVGIGTTTPNVGLEVAKFSPAQIAAHQTGAVDFGRIAGLVLANGPTFLGINDRTYLLNNLGLFGGSADFSLQYWDGASLSERLRVNSIGNVGIGTAAPSKKLDVVGSIKTSDTLFASNVSSNSPLQLQTAGTTRMYINDATGNVGIGASIPEQKLAVFAGSVASGQMAICVVGDLSTGNEFSSHINMTTLSPDNPVRLAFSNGTSAGQPIPGSAIAMIEGRRYSSGGGGYLAFQTRAIGDQAMLERVRIDSSGNVGIGTINPGFSALLELSSTTKGFVLPRMTKTQRDAIAFPVAGMMIYQTDNTPGLRVYNGTNWMRFTETAD